MDLPILYKSSSRDSTVLDEVINLHNANTANHWSINVDELPAFSNHDDSGRKYSQSLNAVFQGMQGEPFGYLGSPQIGHHQSPDILFNPLANLAHNEIALPPQNTAVLSASLWSNAIGTNWYTTEYHAADPTTLGTPELAHAWVPIMTPPGQLPTPLTPVSLSASRSKALVIKHPWVCPCCQVGYSHMTNKDRERHSKTHRGPGTPEFRCGCNNKNRGVRKDNYLRHVRKCREARPKHVPVHMRDMERG